MSIILVVNNNPFDNKDRIIINAEYIEGYTIKEYVSKNVKQDIDYTIFCNSKQVNEYYTPKDNTLINIIPQIKGGSKDKKIVGTVLSVMSFGLGSVVSGGSLFAGIGDL